MKKTVFFNISKEPYVSFSRSYQLLFCRSISIIKHQWVSESFFRVNDIVGFTMISFSFCTRFAGQGRLMNYEKHNHCFYCWFFHHKNSIYLNSIKKHICTLKARIYTFVVFTIVHVKKSFDILFGRKMSILYNKYYTSFRTKQVVNNVHFSRTVSQRW